MSIRYGSEQAIRIAFATSEPGTNGGFVSADVHPCRWTELEVYYDPAPEIPRKPWISVSRGHSTHPGETLKEEINQVGTLERALKLFGDSQLGRSVTNQAEDWAETEWVEHAPGFINFGSDEAAMRWLYGDELDQAKAQTLLARDFGAGESTVRMALASDRPIKVPFAQVARFIDRKAFRRWRETQGA